MIDQKQFLWFLAKTNADRSALATVAPSQREALTRFRDSIPGLAQPINDLNRYEIDATPYTVLSPSLESDELSALRESEKVLRAHAGSQWVPPAEIKRVLDRPDGIRG
jgi:hypothetical protein